MQKHIEGGITYNPSSVDRKTEVRTMDPVLFAAMPNNFDEYVRAHPEILPDYTIFANDVISLANRARPDQVITLTGPYGIGKTRVLTPAILKAAEQRGYSSIGSFHGLRMELNPEWIDKWSARSDFEESPQVNSYQALEERLKKDLYAHFSASSDKPKLLILDELAAFDEKPHLLHWIYQLAQEYKVKLIYLTPEGISTPKQIDAFDNHLNDIANITGASLLRVQIPEQTVPVAAIPTLLKTFGIEDPALDEAFSRNPNLRRLQFVELIVKQLFAKRKSELPDYKKYLTREDLYYLSSGGKSLLVNIGEHSNVGMTTEAFETAVRDIVGGAPTLEDS